MQYTSHCRAIMTIRVVDYLKERMKSSDVDVVMEAEYALADSAWFNMIVSSVKVEEIDQVLASLKEQENYYKHRSNDNRYTKQARKVFEERVKMYEDIQNIINKCIKGKDYEV